MFGVFLVFTLGLQYQLLQDVVIASDNTWNQSFLKHNTKRICQESPNLECTSLTSIVVRIPFRTSDLKGDILNSWIREEITAHAKPMTPIVNGMGCIWPSHNLSAVHDWSTQTTHQDSAWIELYVFSYHAPRFRHPHCPHRRPSLQSST